MLDPITALAIAGNIAQFIDLGLKITSKAREIQRSASGTTNENADLELIVTDLRAVNAQLYSSIGTTGDLATLGDLCQKCAETADELIKALDSFKVVGNKSKWKSARKALKVVLGRHVVEDMKSRLLGFREQLKLHILVRLKNELDLLAIQQNGRFDELDDRAKKLLEELILSRETLAQSLQEQEAINQKRQRESLEFIEAQQTETRKEVIVAVESAAASTETQFEMTRKEIEIVSDTVMKQEDHLVQLREEVRRLAQALARARTDHQRRKIQEKSNRVTETLCKVVEFCNALATLLEKLKAQAVSLLASIKFAQLWKAQEEASLPFSFQRPDSATSIGTKLKAETEEIRQRRTAVLCSNYYYYYFPLCRRRHIVLKNRVRAQLNSIYPVDAETQAQFPNLPLLLTLSRDEWKPNFAWAFKDAIELPFLFHLPSPSVAYDFLSLAIAFSAIMPHIADESYAEDILADLFGNSTYLSAPRGSAQRQRIKNDFSDWQKIAGLLWLDVLFNTCREEACELWQVESSKLVLENSGSNTESEPLLIKFWLWLMSGWSTCFSFDVPHNPHISNQRTGTMETANEAILVYTVADFLVRSSYNLKLKIEDAGPNHAMAKVYFLGTQNELSVPAPAIISSRRQSPVPDEELE